MREFLPYFALAISVIACVISGWVAIRAGRWRDSEAHDALVKRVDDLEGDGDLIRQRLDGVEKDLEALPTKADFARLEGEIKMTCKIADRTEKAVQRLEDWLIERGGK